MDRMAVGKHYCDSALHCFLDLPSAGQEHGDLPV